MRIRHSRPRRPAIAAKPPPATRSHQVDAGLRYTAAPALALLLGVFEIRKPYFNLDTAVPSPAATPPSRRYRALGEIGHRGLEASVHYAAQGLRLVAGAVLLRPRVSLEVPQAVARGSEPVGPVPGVANLNLDYVLPRWSLWAGSLQLTHLSARVATLDDSQRLAPLTVLDAGLRYQVRGERRTFTARLDLTNLANATGLRMSTLGQVQPQFGRRLLLNLSFDE